ANQNLIRGLPPTMRTPQATDDVTKGYLEAGSIASIIPANFPAGYTTATIALGAPPAGGVQATATPVIFGGQITSYRITNPGRGYTSVPAATISGDGTGAAATVGVSAGSLWLAPN